MKFFVLISILISIVFFQVFCSDELNRKSNLSLFNYSENIFFKVNDPRRFGVEIEFGGINSYDTAKILQTYFGGTLSISKREILVGIDNISKNSDQVYKVVEIDDYVVNGTSLGDLKVITEFNEESSIIDLAKVKKVTEVITPPLNVSKLYELDRMAMVLRQHGAKGTRNDLAVGIHVTCELNNGVIKDELSLLLVDLLRNIMSNKHWKENQYYLNIPNSRAKYLTPYSDGFMKKLLNPNYRPTMDELYDDFIYRQTLELLNISESSFAWTRPINEVKKIVLSKKEILIPEVVKFSPIKITSLLIAARPNDYMSKIFGEIEEWIKPGPVVEFRQFNNDFKISSAVKSALGLLSVTEDFGSIAQDEFVEEITNIKIETLRKVRSYLKKNPQETYVFRYLLSSQNLSSDLDWKSIIDLYDDENILLGYLPEEKHGMKPLILPGESVVFHRRPHHRFSIMGKYNPAIINHSIAQSLEHKYLEYRFWDKYVPGSMPETYLLNDILNSIYSTEEIIKKINLQFPNGWVMKGVFDLATEKHLITNELDVLSEIANYKNSDFDEMYAKLKREMAGSDIEEIIDLIKSHPNYYGWKLTNFFNKPKEVILQQKVEIAREFRVEVIAGFVLGKGTTLDRYAYLQSEKGEMALKRGSFNISLSQDETLTRVENFAQEIIDRLPSNLKTTPFALDVAVLRDGSLTLIESNPGGNSGFLAYEDNSVKVLNDFLKNYPELERTGQVNKGMSDLEQLRFIKNSLKEWNINQLDIPDMVFLDNIITDKDFSAVTHNKYKKVNRVYKRVKSSGCLKSSMALLNIK